MEFTPSEVGGHPITVQYSGHNVVGSPFTAYTYDASRVKIVDAERVGSVGREIGFTSNALQFKFGVHSGFISGHQESPD